MSKREHHLPESHLPQNHLPEAEATMELMPARVSEWHRLPADERPALVDCREPEEVAICRIEGSLCMPMAEIPAAIGRLKDLSERGIVIYCHHGMRSLHATSYLRERGIEQTFSMAGGIELWACEIEPEMARY